MGFPFPLAAWLLLLFSQNAPTAAQALSPARFDGRQLKLLEENHYLLQNDGTVRHASNSEPVRQEEIPYLIERLESVQRLKALLRLDLILSKSQGEKHLTAEERQAIRSVVRENWPILAYSTRKKFKNYLSPEELAAMNADLPAAPISPLSMKDPDIPTPEAQTTAALPPPPIPAPHPATAAPAPAAEAAAAQMDPPMVVISSAPPVRPNATPQGPQDAAASAAQPVRPNATPQGPQDAAASAALATALVAVQTPVTILPVAPPPLPETAPEGFIFGQGPAPAAPPPPPPHPVAPITPVPPAPAAEAAAAPAPPLEETTPTDLEKFLLQAPYGRDAKAMIRLISQHAPEAARKRALSALRLLLPQVSLDSEKAKDTLRSRLERAARENQSPLIILRPAVVIEQRKSLFFGATETIMPDTSKNHEASYREEKTRWGQTRVFEDGSRRVAFGLEQQAGLLLAELLRLDIGLREPAVSARQAEICARTAQMIFYSKIEPSLAADRFLDLELRHDLRLWREHPAEYRDHLAHSSPAYDGPDTSVAPSAALAEAMEAEKRFRQERENLHEKE